jgi:type II secretory pathway pseudopilin PulG
MRRNGFTLVELMVSLTCGLIIGVAVVALSKEATNAFHEETRTATAEMQLRTAVERIRNDLLRASYQSSANIQTDPFIAKPPSQATNLADNTTFAGLGQLAGVRLYPSGSLANTTKLSSLNDNQSLTPDAIRLSGNFTSTEAFPVRQLDAGTGACNGQRLWLNMDTPSMWRVRSTPDPDATMRGMFQPVTNEQFLVRIEDDTGHFQYVPTCSGVATAGYVANGGTPTAWIDVVNSGAFKVLSSTDTAANGGASGWGGNLLVNPVQTVQWEIRPLDKGNASDLAYTPIIQADGLKFDLLRTYVNATGNLTAQTEVIAEYAIDLKFGFSADLGLPATNPRVLSVYGLSDANNAKIADDVTKGALVQPQRIRSVRVRVSTRAAIADRAAGLIAPKANAQQDLYPLRYCIIPGGCTVGENGWTRVRTTTTEVALPNQAKVFF